MSRTLPTPAAGGAAVADLAAGSATEQEPTEARPREETLTEQVAFAIILAILIRAFVAEAFVIPTGSMAPTLMGRHKEIVCPQCEFVYAVNASDESESSRSDFVEEGICVNCRYIAAIKDEPSFKGDRILVMKFPYDLPFLPGAGKPKRWEVIVFHYPEEPELNYIKRLVGLPNEEIRVYAGDVLTRPRGSTESFKLEQKPTLHLISMLMPVYDDRHRPKALKDKAWRRWTGGDDRWTEKTDGVFTADPGVAGLWTELRYRHLVPDPEQWEAELEDRALPRPPRPSLITDFYSYNTSLMPNSPPHARRDGWYQPHWVGDLALSARIESKSATGKIALRLVRGGVTNRCEIDLATGKAILEHGAVRHERTAETAFSGKGSHDIRFANVDGRLTLWVDGSLPFGEGWVYNDGSRTATAPAKEDLDPAGIAVQDAKVDVSNLVIDRDVYYTQHPTHSDYEGIWSSEPRDPIELFDRLSDPTRFADLGNVAHQDFAIGPGKYMAMGDNSPKSKDGRAWEDLDKYKPGDGEYTRESGWRTAEREKWEIPENLLVGKAFFVYWPHGVPFGPKINVNHDFLLPFRPYWERMKWIR